MITRLGYALLAFAAFTFFSIGTASAGEHPTEHPSEHPREHPGADTPEPLTLDQLADAIVDYVDTDSALKGGYFLVYDGVNGEALMLTLDKVHKERLSHIGNDVYFVCADFKTPAGKVYDLDIFMQGESADELTTTQVTVHKESGVARYGWLEEDGIWKMKPVS